MNRLKNRFHLLGIALAALLLPGAFGDDPRLVNGILVIVNDTVITMKDVYASLAEDIDLLERQYAGRPQLLDQKLKELHHDRVEQLVESRLILHEFETIGGKLPESYIENRIAEDVRRFGDRLTLTKTLQADGITYETYRKRIREKTIIDLMVREKVPRDPLVSPARIEAYYRDNQDKFKLQDQVKLRMVFVPSRASDRSFSPVRMAKELLAKINEGVPFADMAKVYSQGSQAVEGGDWGWVEKSVLRPELAALAFTMKPGGKSDVIETPDGCFIMLVEDTRIAHTKPLLEVRDEIEATLKAQESRRLRQQWISRLKAKQFVRYF